MSSIDEIRSDRINKLTLLKERGIDPYPTENSITHSVQEFTNSFESLEKSGEPVTIGGRIKSIRTHGGSAFVDIFDGTNKTQIFIKKDEVGEEAYQLFADTIDKDDFIEATGNTYTTKRGEKSLLAKSWKILAKSIRPIPDEWFGLKDEEERYRKRYLDILLNEKTHDLIKKRSVFWNTFRDYLLKQDFIEVETPILENTTGGAEARPFTTHHNALDIDLFLRISAGELWQKRLLIGGLPKVFEIGRIFRNEGMSSEHLQDYTQLEFYMAFSDFKKGMAMVKEMYQLVAKKTFGTSKFSIRNFEVDLSSEWHLYHFSDLIEKEYGVNPRKATLDVLEAKLKKAHIDYDQKTINIERAVDLLWKKIRKTIGGPGFLVGVPVYLEPLAKKSPEDKNTVERFQIIIAGSEVGKGFSELNDPIDQAERFAHQQALRDAGDDEAQMADNDFVEALEYGMPPAFGFGVSERLFSFLAGESVREAQIFPLMRPR